MLTGKLVRVRHARNKLVPMYLAARDGHWLDVAQQLLYVYRDSAGRTRGELNDELGNLVGDGPQQLVHQGLAKLLEDRCEYEVFADHPPEAIREAAFLIAAKARTENTFDRAAILAEVAAACELRPEQVELALFADLKDEQRILTFADCTPEFLVNRYNVALAQAILLRAVGMTVRLRGETPARFRQLFRAMKFHRLIGTIRPEASSFLLTLDGPLSLFSATQKYGMQLAFFLPTLLHAKSFELNAEVRWGAERKPKTFALSSTDGLQSHTPDFGMFAPKEFELFAASFAKLDTDWKLIAEPNPVPLGDTLWVPDFTLKRGKQEVYLELFGFWRKTDIEKHHAKLSEHLPGKFLLAVSEQLCADESADLTERPEVYRFKRTPSAEEVAKRAARV